MNDIIVFVLFVVLMVYQLKACDPPYDKDLRPHFPSFKAVQFTSAADANFYYAKWENFPTPRGIVFYWSSYQQPLERRTLADLDQYLGSNTIFESDPVTKGFTVIGFRNSRYTITRTIVNGCPAATVTLKISHNDLLADTFVEKTVSAENKTAILHPSTFLNCFVLTLLCRVYCWIRCSIKKWRHWRVLCQEGSNVWFCAVFAKRRFYQQCLQRD